jgi:hypothetical protein
MDFLFVAIIILAICFYFLPTMIASIRHSEHGTGIFWVNLLFGWTVLGWIAALIWAVTERIEEGVITAPQRPPEQQGNRSIPFSESGVEPSHVGLFAVALAVMGLLAWLPRHVGLFAVALTVIGLLAWFFKR